MASRSLELLTPYMKKRAIDLVALSLQRLNIHVLITNTGRLEIEQRALYAQGRDSLSVVNMVRKKAFLAPITAEENESCVTWTLDSLHIIKKNRPLAEAFDFAILLPSGKVTWDIKVDTNLSKGSDYEEVGALGETLGLIWGGRWKKPDRPHFQQPKNL